MKLFATALLLIVGFSATAWFFWYKPKFTPSKKTYTTPLKKTDDNRALMLRLKQKAVLLKENALSKGYESKYCFMVDMHIASGKKRFFIYNLQKDSVESAGLVTHGSGSATGEQLTFSNVPGSYCTSLGRYKIGNAYNGKFGLAFKLYGLDKTNSKAYDRFVVLHAHDCVPDGEVDPVGICESQGCPTVSPAFLQVLKGYINKAEKPVLLSIFY